MRGSIWVYPWDILDEGADTVTARAADAGLQAISVAAAYHTVRALCPHNPRRAVYHGEGGVVYFRPDRARFTGGLAPVESALLSQGDALALACDAASRRGLGVRAWMVLHHNTRLGTAVPETTVENAFGDRYPFALCPANPAVRAYSVGLVASLAARYPVEAIELESLGYMGLDHTGHHSKAGIEVDVLHRFLLSICFCRHCTARMSAAGVAPDRARKAVVDETRRWFDGAGRGPEDPLDGLRKVLSPDEAAGVLEARSRAVVSLLEEIRATAGPGTRLCVFASPDPLATGAAVPAPAAPLAALADEVLTQAFSADPAAVAAQVAAVAGAGGTTPTWAGLQAVEPYVRAPGDLAASVRAAREAGAAAVELYHYGLMPLRGLDGVRAAMEGASQAGRPGGA